jgi:hypothetical protein
MPPIGSSSGVLTTGRSGIRMGVWIVAILVQGHVAAGQPPPHTGHPAPPQPKAAAPATSTSPIPAPQPSSPEEAKRLDELRALSKNERNAKYNMFKRAMTTTSLARQPPAAILDAWKAACAAPGPCECIPSRKVITLGRCCNHV